MEILDNKIKSETFYYELAETSRSFKDNIISNLSKEVEDNDDIKNYMDKVQDKAVTFYNKKIKKSLKKFVKKKTLIKKEESFTPTYSLED